MAKKRLGRGLGALFPQMTEAADAQAESEIQAEKTQVEKNQAGEQPVESASKASAPTGARKSEPMWQSAPRLWNLEDQEAEQNRQQLVDQQASRQRTARTAEKTKSVRSKKSGQSTSAARESGKHTPVMRSWNSITHPSDLFFSVDPIDVSRETSQNARGTENPDEGSSAMKSSDAEGAKAGDARGDEASGRGDFRSAATKKSRKGAVKEANQSANAKEADASSRANKTSRHEDDRGNEQDAKAAEGNDDQQPSGIPGAYLAEIAVSDIKPNPYQPRTIFDEDEIQALSDSIKEVGVLQPVVVRKINHPQGDGAKYELIMGERRWRASQRAGMKTIPAIVRTTKDSNMLRDALLENLQRVQLNPLEEAAAYQQMMQDFSLTQEQLSKSISKSRSQIANTLRLLQLPASVQKKVAAGVLSAGHARALLALSTEQEMMDLANRIVREGLSVRTTEELVALSKRKNGKQSARSARKDYWSQSGLPQQLEDYYNTKVTIKGTPKKGRIEIVFSSEDDLKRIADILMTSPTAGPLPSDNDGWQ